MKGHAVITGASSGIGEALARELSRAGWAVSLVARRRERLEGLAAELEGPSHVVAADLVEADTSWLAEAESALGPVDLLVNNAGVQLIGPTAEVDPAAGARSVQLNLVAPLTLVHAVLPGMLARGGTIVNVASMAALAPTPGMTWYNAGKAGLAGASEALRGELLSTPVRVITVYPGIIGDTDMALHGLEAYEASWAVSMQPTATAGQLATRVRRAIERSEARVVYPRANVLARWFPAPTRWLMDHLAPPPVSP